jgi:hypothetical protein
MCVKRLVCVEYVSIALTVAYFQFFPGGGGVHSLYIININYILYCDSYALMQFLEEVELNI